MIRRANSRPRPIEPGSRLRWTAHASGHANGAFQPPKKSVTIRRRDDEDVDVLGEEEEPEPHPGVLGREARDDLAVGLGQVERRPVRLRRRGDEEDQRAERLLEHVPVREPAGLLQVVIWLRLIVPARISSPTTDRVSGIS